MKTPKTIPVAIVMSAAILALASSTALGAEPVLILTEKEPPPPVRHALGKLQDILSDKGLAPMAADPELDMGGSRGAMIEIQPAPQARASEWPKPESFEVAVNSRNDFPHIVISGSDAVGLMYGIYELTDQVAAAPGDGQRLWSALQDASGAPALEVRADNPFITLEDDDTISPWFYDEAFWEGYFDTLSRNRYNLCDIHAMYSLLHTTFPNIFPYFLKNPDIPQASWPTEDQERNLAMLNRIIDLAEERGVHVALMNYSMDFPGIDHGDEATSLAQTKWAVKEILDRCPRLWMFGFRIGESGRSEEFFEEAYLGGIAAADKPDVRLYTRTWLAEFKDLAKIGMRYPDNFYIEIKYNGEHLGAPYHAIQGRWGSYSYEQYLNYPRYWKVVWQVRANGTHRIFPWCDPELARRCVTSCTFGDAVGLTLEPITAYYTQLPERVFQPGVDASGLDYIYERYWAWYLVWGRLAYDPDTPEDVFRNAFRLRYGDQAGDRIYALLTQASRIVPLIYRHHCLGPDHRTMAPEFESGNRYNAPPGADIDTFAVATVLDEQEYLPPAAYVEAYLDGRVNGKTSPLDAADRLERLADECLDMVNKVRPAHRTPEWRLLERDLRALAYLARYYVAKDRAACALQFYYKTGDVSRVPLAREYVEEAVGHWERLSETTAEQYRPILDPLRTGKEFTWASVMIDLEADLRRVHAVEQEIERTTPTRHGHVPVRRAIPGQDLVLTAGVAAGPDAAVTLRYRVGDAAERQMPCKCTDQWTYEAVIPGAELRQVSPLAYSFTGQRDGETFEFPDGPWTAVISSDDRGPALAFHPIPTDRIDRTADTLHVTCSIDDPSGIESAWIEWKPMPSNAAWAEPISLTAEDGDTYGAEVPLTHEGLLYSAVAVDTVGNATRAPDERTETPYIAVAPWDPGLSPDMALQNPGELANGLEHREMDWQSASNMDRPGVFYEYWGKGGSVALPFAVETYSDYALNLASVVHRSYGRARVSVGGVEVGVLDCGQDVAVHVPVTREFCVRRLEPGAHTLTLEMLDSNRVGIEGFGLTPQPARIETFLISQSFPGPTADPDEAPYPVGDAGIAWRPAETDERGVVYLDAQLQPNENCHAYAAALLTCDDPVETHLLVGSNDGNCVWLNGEVVSSRPGERFFKYNEDRVPVKLKKGKNLLVVVVMQTERSWMFNVNIESYDVRVEQPTVDDLR